MQVGVHQRAINGFIGCILIGAGFLVYMLWMLTPEEILHKMQITYYPDKYWGIALPGMFVMILVCSWVHYYSMFLKNTKPLDSMFTIADNNSRYMTSKGALSGLSESERQGSVPPFADIPASVSIMSSPVLKDNSFPLLSFNCGTRNLEISGSPNSSDSLSVALRSGQTQVSVRDVAESVLFALPLRNKMRDNCLLEQARLRQSRKVAESSSDLESESSADEVLCIKIPHPVCPVPTPKWINLYDKSNITNILVVAVDGISYNEIACTNASKQVQSPYVESSPTCDNIRVIPSSFPLNREICKQLFAPLREMHARGFLAVTGLRMCNNRHTMESEFFFGRESRLMRKENAAEKMDLSVVATEQNTNCMGIDAVGTKVGKRQRSDSLELIGAAGSLCGELVKILQEETLKGKKNCTNGGAQSEMRRKGGKRSAATETPISSIYSWMTLKKISFSYSVECVAALTYLLFTDYLSNANSLKQTLRSLSLNFLVNSSPKNENQLMKIHDSYPVACNGGMYPTAEEDPMSSPISFSTGSVTLDVDTTELYTEVELIHLFDQLGYVREKPDYDVYVSKMRALRSQAISADTSETLSIDLTRVPDFVHAVDISSQGRTDKYAQFVDKHYLLVRQKLPSLIVREEDTNNNDGTRVSTQRIVKEVGWIRLSPGEVRGSRLGRRPTKRAEKFFEKFKKRINNWLCGVQNFSDSKEQFSFVFAFDCEMVRSLHPTLAAPLPTGAVSLEGMHEGVLLGRATLIHVPSGITLVDCIVRPHTRIGDCVTRFSGITKDMFNRREKISSPAKMEDDAETESDISTDDNDDPFYFDEPVESPCSGVLTYRDTATSNCKLPLWRLSDVQSLIQLLLDERATNNSKVGVTPGDVYIIGHSLENDFKACRIALGSSGESSSSDRSTLRIIDTAYLYPHPEGGRRKNALRFLAKTILHKTIQTGVGSALVQGHDSAEDATICAELVLVKLLRGVHFFRSPWIAHPAVRNIHSTALADTMEAEINRWPHIAELIPVQFKTSICAAQQNGCTSVYFSPVAQLVVIDDYQALRRSGLERQEWDSLPMREILDARSFTDETSVEKLLFSNDILFVPAEKGENRDNDAVNKATSYLRRQVRIQEQYENAIVTWRADPQGLRGTTGPPVAPRPLLLWVQLKDALRGVNTTAGTEKQLERLKEALAIDPSASFSPNSYSRDIDGTISIPDPQVLIAENCAAIDRQLNNPLRTIIDAAPRGTLVFIISASTDGSQWISAAQGVVFGFIKE